jgi:hypothetical protein
MDVSRGTLSRFTNGSRPAWSPDSTRIGFNSIRDGFGRVDWQRVGVSAPAELVFKCSDPIATLGVTHGARARSVNVARHCGLYHGQPCARNALADSLARHLAVIATEGGWWQRSGPSAAFLIIDPAFE